MLTYEVSLNFYVLAFVMGLSFLVGFAFRARMIWKYRAKIDELQREILSNCAHILDLEKETLDMEDKIQDIKRPVITMKTSVKEVEVISKKVPDVSLRKQLLSKKNIEQQSASGL